MLVRECIHAEPLCMFQFRNIRFLQPLSELCLSLLQSRRVSACQSKRHEIAYTKWRRTVARGSVSGWLLVWVGPHLSGMWQRRKGGECSERDRVSEGERHEESVRNSIHFACWGCTSGIRDGREKTNGCPLACIRQEDDPPSFDGLLEKQMMDFSWKEYYVVSSQP